MAQGYNSPNRVDVYCDKPAYFAGEVVQGYVLLTINEPFAARSVNVEVVGFESVHWSEVKVEEVIVFDGVDEIITKIPHNARKEFFEIDVPLYQFDETQLLAPGQYQFPFRMALPANLPGSFRFDDQSYESDMDTYESVHARVEYKIKAFVMLAAGRRSVAGAQQQQPPYQQQPQRCPNLHDSLEIIVLQRLVRAPSELCAETVKEVRSCCFSAGMVVVRVRAAKDSYVAGETALMVLEIENHTDLRFEEVWTELDRIVCVRAAGCRYLSEEKLHKQRFPGLPAGTSYLGDGAKQLSFILPLDLEPTTVAGLVSCSYRVWVQLSAGAWTSHPRLQVPITVYTQPPAPPPPPRGMMYGPAAGTAATTGGAAGGAFGAGPQVAAQPVVVNLPCTALPGYKGPQQQGQPQQQQQPFQGPQAAACCGQQAGPGPAYPPGPAMSGPNFGPQPAGPGAPFPPPAAAAAAPYAAPFACPPPSAPPAPNATYTPQASGPGVACPSGASTSVAAAAGGPPTQPQQQPGPAGVAAGGPPPQQQPQAPPLPPPPQPSLGNEWHQNAEVGNPLFANLA